MVSDAQLFKPKGFAIYGRKTGRLSLDGRSPAYVLCGLFKSKGRKGARTRSLFARASEGQRLRALDDWLRGYPTNALAKEPNNV